jgi:hypothetical protein
MPRRCGRGWRSWGLKNEEEHLCELKALGFMLTKVRLSDHSINSLALLKKSAYFAV